MRLDLEDGTYESRRRGTDGNSSEQPCPPPNFSLLLPHPEEDVGRRRDPADLPEEREGKLRGNLFRGYLFEQFSQMTGEAAANIATVGNRHLGSATLRGNDQTEGTGKGEKSVLLGCPSVESMG
ncbi:hypothetical protein KM043_015546 [Ampulex compressa]|nr:hypothetical protein KM043_015546 [Ampulex compressa]